MQACVLLLYALCLSPPGAYAMTNTTTNTTNTTTTTSTTTTTTITNTTSTTNATTTTTRLITTSFNGTTTTNNSNTTITTTTSTTTTFTTTTNSSTTTNSTSTTTLETTTTLTAIGDMMESIDSNEFMNGTLITGIILDLVPQNFSNTTGIVTTTTSTTATPGTTTSVTTTSTTTLGKECDTPTDPAGIYTLEPYSFGDNSSWKLKCNDTHLASNGLTLAKCLGNGLLRPAGVCMEKGCASET